MLVPYEFPFVEDEIGPRLRIVGDEQATRENSFKAVNDACVKIRATKDDHWGLLKKTGGANAFGFAADVWLYDLQNGTAQVVDVVGNSEGAPPPEGGPRGMPVPAWGEKDIRSIAEWSEPLPPYEPDGGGDVVPPPSDDLTHRVEALESVVSSLSQQVAIHEAQLADKEARIAALEAQADQPLRAHGPVNLPIILESLTSLRARGDIDVEVTMGTATPPPPAEESDLSPGKLWLWLKHRRDDGSEEGGS